MFCLNYSANALEWRNTVQCIRVHATRVFKSALSSFLSPTRARTEHMYPMLVSLRPCFPTLFPECVNSFRFVWVFVMMHHEQLPCSIFCVRIVVRYNIADMFWLVWWTIWYWQTSNAASHCVTSISRHQTNDTHRVKYAHALQCARYVDSIVTSVCVLFILVPATYPDIFVSLFRIALLIGSCLRAFSKCQADYGPILLEKNYQYLLFFAMAQKSHVNLFTCNSE